MAQTVALAAQLSTVPPSEPVDLQEALHRVTMVLHLTHKAVSGASLPGPMHALASPLLALLRPCGRQRKGCSQAGPKCAAKA